MKKDRYVVASRNFMRRLAPHLSVCLLPLLLLLPAAPGWAAPAQRLRGTVPAAATALKPIGQLAATNEIHLAIGLPLRNTEALGRLLKELYDPAHPNYRHYLTLEEFTARFGPTEQDYQAVIAFAHAKGLAVRQTHPNRTLVDVSGSAADLERALRVTLRVYRHPTEARTFYAPEAEPELDLAVPLRGISGLNNYAVPRPRLIARPLDSRSSISPARQPNAGSGPSGTYMGNDFRAAYVPGTALTGAGQYVGLVQFDGYRASDISYYKTRAGLPDVPLINVLLDGFSGDPTGMGGEVEVCLDIEAAISMAPGLDGVIVYMAGPWGNFHDVLNRMATDNLAKNLSCSWYMPGAGADPVADQIFQQMAAQGQSFFNASGDYCAFTGPVSFPGETPYIIQVGGTTLTTSGPGGAYVSETVWNWHNGIGSGGGISTRYAIPSYQADIDMSQNQGSTTMRNIPDVALTADNVYVRANSRDYSVGGTSCSAPLWAGFTALVNQQAVRGGRPVVGFINPAVDAIGHASSYTAAFHDTTTGDNTSAASPTRFYAVPGYDLCTGWGTPAGQKLIDALATPDPLLITPALGLAFSGNVGGPFSANPASLTLTNTGTNTLSWTLVNTSAWFNVSPASGMLDPGGAATTVEVSVDPAANTLPAGVYTAVLAFTNLSSGLDQSTLLALSIAVPGMADDFEPGIDPAQWLSFGGSVGTTVLATNFGGSVSGSNSLWFGAGGSRYATTVPINTSAGGQIGFCLRLADGAAWPWAKVNALPAEGVVFECSTNGGGSWSTLAIYDTPVCYNWTGAAFPIPAAAQGPAVVFRWRQSSNSGADYDHWALDSIIIGTGEMAPQILLDPQSQNVLLGDPAALNVAAVANPACSYQWMLNGTNLEGATTSSLTWASVQLTDTGTYSVLVSNNLGAAQSSDAVFIVQVPPCAPPPFSLVGWWRAEGDAVDEAESNNGTLMGGTSFSTGRAGQAFEFNSTDAYVEVPSSANLKPTGPFSVEAWVRYDTFTGPNGGTIVAKGRDAETAIDWALVIGPARTLRPHVNAGGHWVVFNCSSTLHTGVWYHVAMVYTGSSLLGYVNGVLDGTASASGTVQATDYPMRIGAYAPLNGTDSKAYLAGRVDELSFYNQALSALEIQAIYGARGTGKCSGPLPPYVVSQPADRTVGLGANVIFSVTAGGEPPLCYQWRFQGTSMPGETGSALSLANVQLTNAGSYDVIITNLYGSTNSSIALLTVLIPPEITGHPEDQTVGAGSNATFTVTATGSSPLRYQWRFNGAAISKATDSSLVLSGVTPGQAGSYSVLVSNTVGSAVSRNATLTVLDNGPCAPPPTGLVSWWAGEGNASDWAGTNNGSLEGIVSFAPGRARQAFDLNGTNSYVNIPSSPSIKPTGPFTVEAWVRYDGFTGPNGGTIVAKGQDVEAAIDWALVIGPERKLRPHLKVGASWKAFDCSSTLATGVWHHVAMVYDGASLRGYVNGASDGSVSASGTVQATDYPFRIGAYAPVNGTASKAYLAGRVDEVSFYNRALSTSDLLAIYNAGSTGKCGPAPTVETPPQSQTVECSSNAIFSVSATGVAPLAYQWCFGGSAMPGETNSLLALTNVGFAQAGSYSVVITNFYGSATGGPAVLTVVDTMPPTITACASNRTVSVGPNCTATLPDLRDDVIAWDPSGAITLSQDPPAGTLLSLGMSNVVFTAQDSSGNASTCTSILTVADTTPPFVQASVLEITLAFDTNCQALLPDLTGTNYIVANDNCSSVTITQAPPAQTALPVGTNTVVLTVSDAASNQTTRAVAVIVPGEPHIASHPASLSAAVSSNALFSVLACGAAPLLYQWQHSSTNLPGATSAVLTLSNITTNDAGDYCVAIANSAGSITSAVATLTVLQPPVITRQPRSVVAAPGATVSFSVSAKGLAPLAYQWQKNGSPLAEQTKASLALTNIQAADFASYSVGITNADGGVLSDLATLTKAASPVICSLSFNYSTFMLTVPTEPGPTYVLEYKDDLQDPVWKVLTTLMGTGSPIPVSDNGLTNATRFYRVRVR